MIDRQDLHLLSQEEFRQQILRILKYTENRDLVAAANPPDSQFIVPVAGDRLTIGYGYVFEDKPRDQWETFFEFALGYIDEDGNPLQAVPQVVEDGFAVLESFQMGNLTRQDFLDIQAGNAGTLAQQQGLQALALTEPQASRLLEASVFGVGTGNDRVRGFDEGLSNYLTSAVLLDPGLPQNPHGTFPGDIDNSLERVAVLSLYFNGGAATVGPNLLAALDEGDRAEAWYEIRYNTFSPDTRAGDLTRRLYESELFGLFDDGIDDESLESQDQEYRGVFRAITKHENNIEDLNAEIDGLVPNAVENFELNLTFIDPRPFQETIQPAFDFLVARYLSFNEGTVDKQFVIGTQDAGLEQTGTLRALLDQAVQNIIAADPSVQAIDDLPLLMALVGLEANLDNIFVAATTRAISGGAPDPDEVAAHTVDRTNASDPENDLIFGDNDDAGEADTLRAGSGDDFVVASAGADSIDGGEGNDTVSYASSTAGVEVFMDGTAGQGGLAQGDVFENNSVEAVIASAFADTVEGRADERDLIIGLGGHDDIDGRSGDDVIIGGLDNDAMTESFAAAGGSESVADADLLIGEDGNDYLSGGEGADFLFGAEEIDPTFSFQETPAFAAPEPDTMQADVFDGGAGNDLIVTAAANSGDSPAQSVILFGEGDGHDVVYLGLGDVIQIKAGTSIAAVESTTRGLEILVEDSPVAFRTEGGDTLLVASGYDAFEDADAARTAVQFLDEEGAVVDEWTLNDVANQVGDLATFEEFPDSYITAYDDHFDERAEDDDPDPSDDGTSGADNLVASAGADFIIARAGADIVDAQGGDDTIRGGAGDDIIDGGDGNDTIDAGSGDDTITGGAGQDILDGGAGNDIYLVGDSDADIYQDLLGGSDTLRFLPGVTTGFLAGDFSRASTGIDRIDGTQAGAVVLRGPDPLAALDWDFTRMQVTGIAAIEGGGADDRITGTSSADVMRGAGGADVLVGGSGNDELDGGAGGDVLDAGFGDDVVTGGDGDDLLSGGFGNDTLNGGSGVDTVSYEEVTQDLTLDLAAGTASGGFQIGSDSLSGIENVIGGAGGDSISGDAAANVITGGAGDDTLTGGDGEDTAVFSGSFAAYSATLDQDVVTVVGPDGTDVLTGIEILRFDDQDVLVSSLGQGGETIVGTAGNDVLLGTAGDDTIDGLEGDDSLDGAGGEDALDGGAGIDVALYLANAVADATIVFNAATSLWDVTIGTETDSVTDVEELRFSDGSVWLVDQGNTAFSIQNAVDAATAGDQVHLGAGTFGEAVLVDKALSVFGQGSGNTTVTPASGSAFTLQGDLGAASTLRFAGLAITGARDYGIEVNGTTLGTLEIADSLFQQNQRNGLGIVDGQNLSNVVVTDSSFLENGRPHPSSGDGDLLFFQFNGDATLQNLTIDGGDRPIDLAATDPALDYAGENAIQFRSDSGALGAVTIDNVTIAGNYQKTGIAFYNYDNVDGLSMSNVDVSSTSGWGLSVNFDGIAGDIDLSAFASFVYSAFAALQGDVLEPNVLTGGDFSDFLNGKAGDDRLTGGAGDDTLEGGGGVDTAIFAGDFEAYSVTLNADGSVTVSGPDGTDTLTGVELLQFDNRMVGIVDDGGTGSELSSVQGAVDLVGAGGRVLLFEGSYVGDVTVNAVDVAILGPNAGLAGAPGRAGEADIQGRIVVLGDGFTLDGVRVSEGNGGGAFDFAGVHVQATDATIANSYFFRSAGGVADASRAIVTSTGSAAGLVILDNHMTGWHSGAFINPGAADGIIEGNVFAGNLVGMSLDGAHVSLTVTSNQFLDNNLEGLGIGNVTGATDADITANTFEGNGASGQNIANYDAVLPLGTVEGNTVRGTAGDDTLSDDANGSGRIGGNVIDGRDGVDTVDYGFTTAGVTVDLAAGTASGSEISGLADDTLIDIENAIGGTGNDELTGGAGSNTLSGGAGADVLTGGLGSDTFVFEDGDGNDRIEDFDTATGGDIVDVSAFGFADYAALSANFAQDGADTRIQLDADDAVTLVGINLADLQEDHFVI